MDAACLVAFVVAGERQHHLSDLGALFVRTFVPLALGWAGAALLLRLYDEPWDVWRAAAVWAVGVPAGLWLRVVISNRVLLRPFAVAAFVALGGFLVGWRAAVWLARNLRR